MVAKVGINGFGRIGRVVFRTCLENPYIKITAINDPAIDAEYICYLIKFDSTHGKFKGNVTHTVDEITVDGSRIKVFHEKLPSNVPWQAADVQYVVEACGMFTSLEKASGHLASDSVKRVIITAPSVDVPMVILGVNHNKLRSEQKVISCASSTLYCLAPIVKILEDKFGVDEGFITCIHAMTPSLKPLDGLCLRGKHWRDHRSIHQNIIPATTGACRALGKIIPQVKDKLSGLAFRVPIVNVSVLDLSIRLIKNTSLGDIVSAIDELSASTMKNLMKTSKDEAVSSDFIGDRHSCILDVTSSMQLKPNFFKLVCWYENEFSYACRVVDSIMFSETQLHLESVSKMTYVRLRPPTKRDMVQQTEWCSKNMTEYDDNQYLENANILRPSSNNVFKAKLIRPIILEKPLSNHISGNPLSFTVTRGTKRKNDTFRVNKNNEILKPALHQNKGSFLHSCVEIMPKSIKQTTDSKTQQHLEKVKKEFTKMVNITKDLLKKSESIKFQSSPCNKLMKRDKIGTSKSSFNQELNIVRGEEKANSYNMILKNPILKVSGDFEPCIGNVNNNQLCTCSKEYAISCNKVKDDISIYYKTSDQGKGGHDGTFNLKTVSGFNRLDKHLNSDLNDNNKNAPRDSLILQNSNAVFKKKVSKTINSLVDGLTQSINIYNTAMNQSNKHNIHDERKIKQSEKPKKLHYNLTDNDSGFTSPSINLPNEINDTSNQNVGIFSTDFDNTTTEGNLQMKITYSYPVVDELKNTSYVSSNADVNTEVRHMGNIETFNDVNRNNRIEIPKKILERMNRYIPDTGVGVSENRPNCTSRHSIKINNENNKKQDIYDKLDSTSATDSDNSFQINERKSQVIRITDLTNSLEDLARLDKICRIIEISDELSDKLFSTLDDAENTEYKKWSFKDLCERIKLDEFCDKLFGK